MENLEQQDKIINLGKLFVQELGLEPGVDTFSRWIAHYLAEKITFIETAEGRKKESAKKECFNIILQLWHHRHLLPPNKRPFQNFESIFEMLTKLNPEKEESYYFNLMRDEDLYELETNNLKKASIKEWLNIALEIDKTARIWIDSALHQAASKAKDERTKEWLENATDVRDNTDTAIIRLLMNNNPLFDHEEEDREGFSQKYNVENLKKRIRQLQQFSQLNDSLLEVYKKELSNIEKSSL